MDTLSFDLLILCKLFESGIKKIQISVHCNPSTNFWRESYECYVRSHNLDTRNRIGPFDIQYTVLNWNSTLWSKIKKWVVWICYSYRIIPNSFFVKETFPIGFNDFSEIKGQFVQVLEFSWKRCLLSLKREIAVIARKLSENYFINRVSSIWVFQKRSACLIWIDSCFRLR